MAVAPSQAMLRLLLSVMVTLFCAMLMFSSAQAQPRRSLPIARTGKVSVQDTAAMRIAARHYFLRGMQHRLLRDYPSAIIELQLALRYDSSAVIAYTIAHSYAQIGKRDIAQEYLSVSLRRNPDYIPSLELEAEFAIDDNRLLGALTIYEHIVALQPKVKQSRYMLCRLLEFSNEEKAIAAYKTLIEENGEDRQLLERLALLQKNINDTNGYIQTAEKLYAMGSDDGLFLREYIQTLFASKRYSTILQYITPPRSSRLGEHLPTIVAVTIENFLLMDSAERHQYYSVVDSIIIAVEKQHFYQWEISYSAGLLSYLSSDTSRAYRLLEQSERLTNDRASLIILQSQFFVEHSHTKKALELLRKGMDIFTKEYRFPLTAALVFERRSEKDSAEKYYHRAIALDSQRSEIWAQLGIFYNRHNNIKASDSCYKRGLVLSPDDPLINNNLAYSYAERGILLEQAKIMAQKAVSQSPKNPSYLDTYAWVLYAIGDYDKAITYSKQALLYSQQNATLYEHLAQAHKAAGNYEEALSAYKKALELDPKKQHIRTIIEELEK